VFRTGANIPDYGTTAGGGAPGQPSLDYMINSIDWGADGYRLMDWQTFFMLTTGGNHQKQWPWGDDAPSAFPAFNQHVHTTIGGDYKYMPEGVSSRLANGYGLKNLIGNVAEWSENAYPAPNPGQPVNAWVFGGSFLGLDKVDTEPTAIFQSAGAGAVTKLFDLAMYGPATSSTSAIGLRCIRYTE